VKRERWRGLGLTLLRVLVSATLIGYVFTELIDYQDTVRLADGGEIRGEVLEFTETGLTIEDKEGQTHEIGNDRLIDPETGAPVHYGFFGVLARAHPGQLLAGLATFCLINLLALVRWRLLLSSQGLHLPFWQIFRWHFVGLFYNTFLPGMTGGDLVKAYYVARRLKGKRTEAVVTILVDRVIGVIGLALLAAFVLSSRIEEPALREAASIIYVFLAGIFAGGIVFFSRRVRRLLRLDAILARIPLAARIDQAIFHFRYHKKTVAIALGLSLISHSVTVSINALYGQALGIEGVSFADYFIFIPTILILTAIPISIGGFGFGEAMYLHFFSSVLPDAVGTDVGNRIVALSLLFRLTTVAWSLLGGLFLLLGEHRPREEKEEAATG
jgi:uncharacterized protein (TIRG00374 family)